VKAVHPKWTPVLAAIAVLAFAGGALANHVTQVDPATVPTGFLAAHNAVSDVPVSALARAVKPDGTDVFIQHVRLGANAQTGWHTHPGPAIVTVVKGSITYQEPEANRCVDATYNAGEGFVDRGFGHVHRAIAGADGVDFYVVYVLPPGSETHVIPAAAPSECTA
jgi:quercetin dioxygenase-like cupin family protein